MSLAAFRNDGPDVMAWATDYKARSTQVHTARYEWMTALYDAHGVPEDDRGAFVNGERFSGISWPTAIPMPEHWFRPVKTPQLIRPRAKGAGNRILKEMGQFDRPDARRELSSQFGMPQFLFAGAHLYTNGVRFEDDGVWVTWGHKACADEIANNEHYDVEAHGWVRVPLVEFIERFGEDAL
jgi:hypothetical protein